MVHYHVQKSITVRYIARRYVGSAIRPMTCLLPYWCWCGSERNTVAPRWWQCFAETCRSHCKKINSCIIPWIFWSFSTYLIMHGIRIKIVYTVFSHKLYYLPLRTYFRLLFKYYHVSRVRGVLVDHSVSRCDDRYVFTFSVDCKELKVRQSHYRPWQTLSVPGDWGSQISRLSAHEGGKVVSLTHRPPLPPEIFLVLSSVEAESTPGPPCGQKDYVNEKFRWHHRESNPRPSGL
jgi:hypothetical protein